MRCHENKNLVMLACAACAREEQHLLGQLLKEIKLMDQRGPSGISEVTFVCSGSSQSLE